MQVLILWVAVGVSLLTFYIHMFIGGPKVAKPLLRDTSLPVASK